ncbi:MAG: SDR family oxidoreductase [Methanobacteriota archaeon]
MKNKKLIITGGLGFIGSNLVERLIIENEVTVIDNLSTGKLDNIKHLNPKNLNLIKKDINDLDLVKIFNEHDYIFHQAALASVPESIQDPLASNVTNIDGTLKILTAAKDSGIKKVICASSSSVYGDNPTLPLSESIPVNPMSPYAVTKATGEFYCKVFQDIYGLKTASLRYFNVFGPRQDPNSQYAAVIPKFINAIMNNEPPVIFGDGQQSRDFIFVKHVVDANILACESDKTGIFNIACGKKITINELVDMINKILGKNIEPLHIDPKPGDIKHSLADISRARTFGYEPESDFKEELRETIRWFSNGSKFEECI